MKHDGLHVVILLLYVDDIILTSSSSTQIQEVVTNLGTLFDLKDMRQLTYFLGLHIQYKENGDLCVNQTKYAKELLIKAGMKHCKPSPPPSKPHTQLLISEGTPLLDPTLYRSLVGALQYLTFARLDIAHVVGVVCQFMHQPLTLIITWLKEYCDISGAHYNVV